MNATPETLRLKLRKWQFKAKARHNSFYFVYFVLIICLAYVVNQIASNIFALMQDETLMTFFLDPVKGTYDNSKYNIVMTVCSGASFFTFFYKTLSDKFGRKPFLVINLFGLALGMFICYLAKNMVLFAFGCFITYFFTPAHMEELYVIETASSKHRGFWLSFCKAIGIMGISLVSFFRTWAVEHGWQNIFLIPAIIGLVVALVCLLLIDESDVFVQNKIAYIKKEIKKLEYPDEVEDKQESVKSKQGGIIAAIKYMMVDKSLLWLFLVGVVFSLSSVATGNYMQIIKPEGTSSSLDPNAIGQILIVYPFFYSFVEVFIGILSDKIGRIKGAIFSSVFTLFGFLLFVVGNKADWNIYFIGALLGTFMGGYMVSLDLFNIICAEKSPTNLRGSILSVINVSFSAGSLIATGIFLLANNLISNMDVGFFALVMIVPALFLSLLILIAKMPETKNNKLFTKIKSMTKKATSKSGSSKRKK